MAQVDETRFNNLESRIAKIEEHIKCSEKAKEQQWKDNLDKKLQDIKEEIKSQGQKSKKIADITTAMGGGLVAIVFAGNFVPLNRNPALGWLFLAVGILAVLYSLCRWYRLNKDP